jgi:BirA family biotin operon repressor/biotin-[acetyl-CoA-carboxylase] ligase
MRGFESVGSTNTAAAEWARDGAPDGSVVVTEYQSAGRGRHGRSWDAKKGQNLMFSVVLRPALAPDRLGLLTVAASVAVAEAVDDFVTPHRAALKWPNDVLLEGRKTCGMLLESSISGRQAAEVVILGVGLNVNQTTFPEALADTATSLRLVAGRAVPRAPLFARLLAGLEARYDAVQGGEAAAVRAAFHDRLAARGEARTLRVSDTGDTVTGVVQGITATGALRLDTPDGPTVVHAGDVTSQM